MRNRTLVIGAGIGGLTTAALLARAGHDVTVLEAHIYGGGCAGTFYHQGYRFDAGATLAGGFNAGGPHAQVGQRLGIEWPIVAAEPAWRTHLPDRVFTRYGDPVRWRAELGRATADLPDHAAIQRFFERAETISDAAWAFAGRRPAWPPAGFGDTLRLAGALRRDTLSTLPHLFESMGAWAARSGVVSRPARAFLDAQLLISAQTTAVNANAVFGAAAIDLPRKGVNHVRGGIGGIAQTLVNAIRRDGGKVLFRQEVSALELDRGRIVAAKTSKGLRVECERCIANLTPWDMARLLGDGAPPALRREIATRPDEWGAFTLYLGVEDSGLPEDCDHHQVVGDYELPLGETNSVFVSLSLQGDPSRAPPGMRAITISTHTRTGDWWALRNAPDGKDAYAARVAAYTERMLDGAERAIPGLRTKIRLLKPGTPVTFRTFTRRHRGGVGGFPFTSLLTARGPGVGLTNTWLVGDSIFPGQSTAGVTMGALRVADEVARDHG